MENWPDLNLKAGRFSLQLSGGMLRYLSLDGSEVVRCLYFALRDKNWGTTKVLQATRTLGRVVEVGIFEKPATFELNDLVFHERELIGIINNSGEFPQAIQMMADGRVDPGPMISSRISLEDVVEKGFEECIRNKRSNVKVIVNCNEELRDL